MAAFDPFNDRKSRDIRNSLSKALVATLNGTDSGAIAATAADCMARVSDRIRRDYIDRRQAAFKRVIAEIEAQKLADPRQQAVVLWNAGLFFEVHELLETVWPGTSEPEHTTLKGLIQAAGVFVQHEAGRTAAARKLALRARKNLQHSIDALWFIANPEKLLAALDFSNRPPRIHLDLVT